MADNIELDRRGAELAAEISRMEAAVNEMAVEDAAAREALRAGEEELKTLRMAVQESQERRAQIEVELVRKQAELKYLDETSRKELNCPVEELVSADDPVPDADSIAAAEQGANEIRQRIEGLGAVNPAAMEEFQEAQQRQEFLSVQRQDLLDSIRDTEKAIQEIDQVSRQKFAEAFEAINANFRGMFQSLFGGGTGEMRLTDQENLAESGIDIVCSPPGKRLQNVLLLSGGEKALAAVALLMAIFRYQPSPFCVLDEVDAPLDEANIGRLANLLKEMSLETQFVVITHSKRTMEAAEALYGVTMQEPGVSRLVAVRFGPAEERDYRRQLGDRRGARTRACSVETLLDTCSDVADRASARVPTRHARVRAPCRNGAAIPDRRQVRESRIRPRRLAYLTGGSHPFAVQ